MSSGPSLTELGLLFCSNQQGVFLFNRRVQTVLSMQQMEHTKDKSSPRKKDPPSEASSLETADLFEAMTAGTSLCQVRKYQEWLCS